MFLRPCCNIIDGFAARSLQLQARDLLYRYFSKLSRAPLSKPKLSNTPRADNTLKHLRPSVVRPLLFCTFASGAAFLGAAAYDHDRAGRLWQRYLQRRQASSDSLLGRMKGAWQDLPLESKVIYGIIGVNAGVFGLWRIPALQGLMSRWFLLPLPPLRMQPAFTALTSTFSHATLVHLGFNMIAFSSFGGSMTQVLGPEQFMAFFISAGMASSLTSYIGRLRSFKGGYSLGASGAVYACFAAVAILYPGATAQFILLPGVPIQMGTLLPVLLSADALGVLLGWRYLDHLGHLGGAAFGILYMMYGHHLWNRREDILHAVGLIKEKE